MPDSRKTGTNASLVSGVRELVGAEVLIVDKDEEVQKGMTQLLSAANLHVTCAGDPDSALEQIGKRFFSVVVVDLDTPTPAGGLDTIERVKEATPTTMVVLLTPRKSFDDMVAAVRAGAVDIVWKSPESVEYLLDRVLEAAGRSVGKREVHGILEDVRETYDDFLKRFMDAERRAIDARGGVSQAGLEEVSVLVVAPNTKLKDALAGAAPAGFSFAVAYSGGEALDRCSSSSVHIAIVGENLPDLPGSMVVRSIKAQVPETLVLHVTGTATDARVDLVESTRSIPVVEKFTHPQQLVARLDELAQAFHAKARERRYTQAFRERHYDFLRRYVELKIKLDRTLGGK